PFGVAYEKIGAIQRRLAWPLHKDDTLLQSGRPMGLNVYFCIFLHFCLKARNLQASSLDSSTLDCQCRVDKFNVWDVLDPGPSVFKALSDEPQPFTSCLESRMTEVHSRDKCDAIHAIPVHPERF
ncbi:hypothetical protein OF83DRAFT_1064034, partial [Amylostereum chailletii]